MSDRPPVILTEPQTKRKRYTVLGIQQFNRSEASKQAAQQAAQPAAQQGVDYVSASSAAIAMGLARNSHEGGYEVTAVFSGYLRPLWHLPDRIILNTTPKAPEEPDPLS